MNILKQERNINGQYGTKMGWNDIAAGVFTLLIVIGTLVSVIRSNMTPVNAEAPVTIEVIHEQPQQVIQTGEKSWTIGTPEAIAKWEKYLEQEVKKLEDQLPVKITAIRTRYSRADSCHNKRGNKCLTAIGRDTQEGVTVACPRSIKLGTKVVIEGKQYICEDRYSNSLDAKRGMPTFDVFAEAENVNKLPAYKVVQVSILK